MPYFRVKFKVHLIMGYHPVGEGIWADERAELGGGRV